MKQLTLASLIEGISNWRPTGMETPVRPILDSRTAESKREDSQREDSQREESRREDPRHESSRPVFFAFKGENVDGHDYVADAFKRGAIAAVIERDVDAVGCGAAGILDVTQAPPTAPLKTPLLIRVHNTLDALQSAARFWRQQLDPRVIGITGSVGKTTTKEVVTRILANHYCVQRSTGSYNNEIGLPLTLLQLTDEDAYIVLEMGMYVRGDIRLLAEIARPHVGIITNVEPVHLERAGSIENIALGKRELVESLPPAPEGVAILNYDDRRVRAMAEHTPARVFFYGLSPEADLWADDVETQGLDGIRLRLHYGGEHLYVKVPLLGRHSAHTVLRATAAGLVEGLDWQEIVEGLRAPGPQLRLVAVQGLQDSLILDDTYNSSPGIGAGGAEPAQDVGRAQNRRLGRYVGVGRLRGIRPSQGRLPDRQHCCGIDHRRRTRAFHRTGRRTLRFIARLRSRDAGLRNRRRRATRDFAATGCHLGERIAGYEDGANSDGDQQGGAVSFALILAGISFLMVVFWGGPYIGLLKRWRIGKRIRIDGPSGHQTKMGTPTMGGALITIPVILITLALNIYNLIGNTVLGRSILVPLGVMIAYAVLGAFDDWAGVKGMRRGEGFTARFKMQIELVLTFIVALVMYFGLDLHSIAIPGVPEKIDIGLFYIPIAMFIIISSANAANLTDGLDGLAGIIMASAFVAYAIIADLQGQIYLERFCFTIVGASFAFLWFNAHPAELMMGDTGSLALGATLGVVALMTGQWLILPIILLMPVSITLSVIIQVSYFKYTKKKYGEGRRVFKMAPLHHHFELLGWSETQVVQRFWLVQLLAAMAGVALALI